jgi:uncharacterized protein GlcG (DUF336 family)
MAMKRFIQQLFIFLFLFRIAPEAMAQEALNSNDVAAIMAQALTRASVFVARGTSTNAVIAVVDREGFVLGVLSLQAAYVSAIDPLSTNLAVIDAITKAGTATFLSSSQNAFTSRTAGFIVQQHFPPRIKNTSPGPLVGVNFSSLAFSDVNYFKNPQTYSPIAYGGGGTNGAPITTNVALVALSGLSGSPGGVPLYKAGQLVGGVGASIAGKGRIPELADIQLTTGQSYDVNEDVALAAQKGYQPSGTIHATSVLLNGFRLPYANSSTRYSAPQPVNPAIGFIVTNYPITNSPPVNYPEVSLGGVTGELRAPITNDPIAGPIDGQPRLSSNEVAGIIAMAAMNAATTRAAIRLPAGVATRMFISVVNNPGQPGIAPTVLGTFRMRDATIFSWDITVQKARTAVYFSANDSAYSTRAVGFMAQTLFPPGINGTAPGPFLGLQEIYSLLQTGVTNPLNGVYIFDGRIPAAPFTTTPNIPLPAPDPFLTNGITLFPGGFPLYRGGVLIGAIGASGDGVDEDDLIAAWGTVNFLAAYPIRSDQVIYRGTRLPYAKFPRNPSLNY